MQTKMFLALLALALSFAAYDQNASSSPDTKAVAFEHAVVIDATGSPAMPSSAGSSSTPDRQLN